MQHHSPPPDNSWENDAVWNLLDHASPTVVPQTFTTDTVRLARLLPEEKPWWSRLFSPAPLAALAGATAAIALGVISLTPPQHSPNTPTATLLDSPQAVAIQDRADQEILIAAADHLEKFSDPELVRLIGL